ncbi:hypothetical protein TGDOM2_366100 [Toxoplasma gondii GAB2-2007-GAL-DOM2]|uniref:Uncharacterized protein n=2 Tax=Toxoplasma gondii TaxID=5811 RepID=A0A086JSP9_TOXGO|nr:hypothetical protein TGDOM2_366100 [Toxoplasma gondii GAB2-2007-GAL-DOM2]KFG35167.1 hypothetical protein TGFOU_366100 [Toxoplasma gondii FOU]
MKADATYIDRKRLHRHAKRDSKEELIRASRDKGVGRQTLVVLCDDSYGEKGSELQRNSAGTHVKTKRLREMYRSGRKCLLLLHVPSVRAYLFSAVENENYYRHDNQTDEGRLHQKNPRISIRK